MSFPSEDRHERDLAGVQPRNPSQEMEKHDKSKLMSGVPGGIVRFRAEFTANIYFNVSNVLSIKRLGPLEDGLDLFMFVCSLI